MISLPKSDSVQRDVEDAASHVQLPADICIRAWTESDFPVIQRLSSAQGWTTPKDRPADTLVAWRCSWPALVATDGDGVVGFVRAITDRRVTMYIAEILVKPEYRGRGIGSAILEVCHLLYPRTRLDLLSTDSADAFYKAVSFSPNPPMDRDGRREGSGRG